MTTPPHDDAAPVDISDSLAYHVHRLGRLLRKHFLFMAAQHGLDLTPEQWFCLNKLSRKGPMSQTALTEDIFSDRPNITRILARLEKRGLIQRAPDPHDGRRQRVSLTAEGAALHDTFSALVPATRQQLFAHIAPGELDATLRVLAALEQSLIAALGPDALLDP